MAQLNGYHSRPNEILDEFASIPAVKIDLGGLIKERLNADPSPRKVNLGPGTYRDEHGKPWVLSSFQTAAERLIAQRGYDHEYLNMVGHGAFLQEARTMIFGQDPGNIASIQTIGGSGAVHMGAEFLMAHSNRPKTAYISDPTWVNHHAMFEHVGWKTEKYRYYDETSRGLDFEGFVADVKAAPRGSVFVVHSVGHNPTGCDPTTEQWMDLAKLFKDMDHFAFIDSAYLGFVSGNMVKDRRSIEIFMEHHVPGLVCQSFSKNAGLYGERLGVLHINCGSAETVEKVTNQLKVMTRREMSSVAKYGADLVAMVCADEQLRQQWSDDLMRMSSRIEEMRHRFAAALKRQGTPGDWSHVTRQRGMFTYTGLNADQCTALTERYHCYIGPGGRMMMAGLNDDNLEYVAKAVHEVVTEVQ